MFPRIIHQTYKTEKLPDIWKDTPASWKAVNPTFEYKFWTDTDIDDFVKTNFPDYVDMMNNFKYKIQKIDTIRYMWLYKFGGIYVDMDIQSILPIEKLLSFFEGTYDYDILLAKTLNSVDKVVLTNSFMVSKPNNNFWIDVLNNIKKNNVPWWCIGKHLEVMYSTGPCMITKMYNDTNYKIGIIPSEFLLSCDVCSPKPCISGESFVKVIEGNSWHQYDSTFFNILYCIPKKTWIFILIILFLSLICFILWKQKKLVECRLKCKL